MNGSSSGELQRTKIAGLSLILGVIALLASATIAPGGPFVDPVERGDIPSYIGVLVDNATLSHVSTLLAILGVLLEAFGVLALLRLRGSGSGFADAALQAGAIGMLFSWGIYVLQMGTVHMAVHLVSHGAGESVSAAQLDAVALAVVSAGGALYIGFLSVSAVASVLLGLGLASRFDEMNAYKSAGYGLALVGVLLLLSLIVLQHIHTVDKSTVFAVNTLVLTLGTIVYFVLGVGMTRGREEFVADAA